MSAARVCLALTVVLAALAPCGAAIVIMSTNFAR